jgi:hypothetical protein
MRLEEAFLNKAGEELARAIDKEIIETLMIDMLTDQGWIQTKINPAFSNYGMMSVPFEDWYSKTAEWIHINATGDYKLLKGQWLFKEPKDAIMFILRWS